MYFTDYIITFFPSAEKDTSHFLNSDTDNASLVKSLISFSNQWSVSILSVFTQENQIIDIWSALDNHAEGNRDIIHWDYD